MDALAWLVILAAVVVLTAGLVWWTRRSVPQARGRRPAPTRREPTGRRVEIMLDVGGADPDSPSVTRLVDEVGNRVLATTAEAEEVVVKDRDGRPLGTVRRVEAPDVAPATGPAAAPEPGPRRHRPDPTRTNRGPVARPRSDDLDVDLTVEPRDLAERFDLPPAVRDELRDPTDAVDLVRAIFAAAGVPAEVDRDVVRSGEQVFIVCPEVHGRPAAETLNVAYHRFRETGARSGVAINLGYASPKEMRRREALEPALSHVGVAAIQRMADAAALGADPRAFATGPSLGGDVYIRNTP